MKKLLIIIVLLFGIVEKGSEHPIEGKNLYIPVFKQKTAKAKFMPAYERMRHFEGYYTHQYGDLGGETYGGVARNFHHNWYGWRYIDALKKQKRIKALPQNHQVEEAEFWVLDFYLDIWVKEGFDNIYDQNVANYLFDFRINSHYGGIIIVQEILCKMGQFVVVDGVMGEATINAINNVDSEELLCRVHEARIKYYRSLVHRNKTLKKFYNGWVDRANKIKFTV